MNLKITSLDRDFYGTLTQKDKKVRVKGALPGEEVTATVPDRRHPELMRCEKVLKKSDIRQKVGCPYFIKCGNCALLHVKADAQAQMKQKLVKDKLSKAKCAVSPIVTLDFEKYRNKVHFTFTEEKGMVRVGFFDEISHRVIPIDSCLLHGEWFSPTAKALEEYAQSQNLKPYDPKNSKGNLRFAVVRSLLGGVQVTLVTHERKELDVKPLYDKLLTVFDSVSIWQNVNSMKNSAVFSTFFIHLMGERKLKSEMLGIKFSLLPTDFFQTNTEMAKRIYLDVLDEVKNSKAEKVIDAYSGIGITSMLFAGAVKEVVGVEIVKSAVDAANEIKKKNEIENATFICDDFERAVKTLDAENAVFFVDPPRKGLGHSVCEMIAGFSPMEIIYLSCGIDALALDLKYFEKSGYIAKKITPYDLFPNTAQIENLVFLKKE